MIYSPAVTIHGRLSEIELAAHYCGEPSVSIRVKSSTSGGRC